MLQLETAFQKRMQTGLVLNLEHKLPEDFLEAAMKLVKLKLMSIISPKYAVKMPAICINFVFTGEFMLPTKEDNETGESLREKKTLATKNCIVTVGSSLDDLLQERIQTILAKVIHLSLTHSL